MSTKPNHVKIGVFVLAAIALLIAGLLAFGAKSYFTPKVMFETAVSDEVSGLAVGSPVQLRGVRVGKVAQIAFAWNLYPETASRHIIVVFEIEKGLLPLPPGMNTRETLALAITNGLRAVLKSQGITGSCMLQLERMDNPPPAPGIDYTPRYFYIPSAPSQFTRVLDAIEATLNHVKTIDFASMSSAATNIMYSMGAFVEKLNQVDLYAIETNVYSLIVDIKATAARTDAMVTQIQDTITGMNLRDASAQAVTLMSEVRESNARLDALLQKIGAMPVNLTLENLQEVISTLNDVLLELKRYPSGFFLGAPPPPVQGTQPAR